MKCIECRDAKPHGGKNIYCSRLGIIIRGDYSACAIDDLRGRTEQHRTPGEKGRDAPVSQAEGQRAAAAGFNSRPACQGEYNTLNTAAGS